jgi:hypothetical protein
MSGRERSPSGLRPGERHLSEGDDRQAVTMILPSSHSPAEMRDHAMGAAGRDPAGGEIPMKAAKPSGVCPERLLHRQGAVGEYDDRKQILPGLFLAGFTYAESHRHTAVFTGGTNYAEYKKRRGLERGS